MMYKAEGCSLWKRAMFAAALLLLPAMQVAAEDAGNDASGDAQEDVALLRGADVAAVLDPETPAEVRAPLLAELQAAARHKNTLALYILGSAYRLGDQHPAKLFPQDLDKAAAYLSSAAAQGEVDAMAGAAEVKLASHDATAAMVWAQLYGHYMLHGPDAAQRDKEHQEYIESGYTAGLLYRCRQALGTKYDDAAILRDANGFLARFGSRVRKHYSLSQDPDVPKPLSTELPPFTWNAMQRHSRLFSDSYVSGVLVVLLGIDANGRAVKAFVIDSEPYASLARAFASVGSQVLPKFSSSSDADRKLYWMLAHYEFADGRYKMN